MSETSAESNSKEDKKLSKRNRSKIVFVERSVREEKPGLTKERKKEYEKRLGERAEPREPSGWDAHPLGTDGVPAEDMRYGVYEEMRSRDFKGRNAVAELFGVSRAFVTKWTNILRAAGELGAGVRNVCRALSTRPPRTIERPAEDAVRDLALSVRARFPFLGPEKIKVMYGTEASASTIGRVIRKFRLQRKHRPYKKHKYVRFEMPFPMYMVQTDYKEWAPGIYSIWVLDDRSRMILGHRVVRGPTAEAAEELLEEVVSRHGLPILVLTDHGSHFTTMHKGGEHVLERWFSGRKIKHVMGRVNHPQTQGKIERSHGSAKAEMEAVWGGRPETFEDFEEAVGAWAVFYNNLRVHQSLGYKTPAEVFFREKLGTDDPRWTEAVRKEFPDGSRTC
jgi:transposase InsO family protein